MLNRWQVISQAQEEKARIWIIRERGAIDEFAETRIATARRRVAVGIANARAVVANAKKSEPAEIRLPCRLFAQFLERKRRS